jgi:hypothetical protein
LHKQDKWGAADVSAEILPVTEHCSSSINKTSS